MNPADTAIALSHMLKPYLPDYLLNPDRSLTEETRQRVDKCVELHRAGAVRTITLSGAHNFNNRLSLDERCTHAYAMAVHARKQGVPEECLLVEDFSLDTVGQAVFTRTVHALPRGWKNIVVVSSDYHLPRAKGIFGFVYGDSCSIAYESVPTDGQTRAERHASELKSIETFHRQFEGVPRGDLRAIVQRLLDSEKGHGFYNGKRLLCSDALKHVL